MKNQGLIYRIIAFTAGFVLMTFELVAARMLAPTIGTSIFVWTNVIGVIMAAMAVGYWLGGKLADKRKEALDIVWLPLAVAASIGFVLVAGSQVIDLTLVIFRDARWQGLFVAVLLFAVPSLLLGIVSPYLAKFAITSTKTSGKTVAGLSTANAVGSILGTFATGFILFGLIGGQIILVTLIIVAVGVSWLIAPKEVWKIRVAASLVLALVAILPVAMTRDNDTVTIDTATARYLVARGAVDGREATMLVAGPKGVQSAVFTDGSEDLVFWYQQQIAQVVDNLHDEDDEFRVLVLGGGAFTTPEYLAKKYPRAQIDVVEIDPGLFNISKRYFGITGASNMRVYGEDARSFVRRAEGNYDFVLVDVFNDIEVPWQFVTREFGNEVGGLLEDGGVVAINMVAAETGGCGQIYDALYGIYARNLPYRYAVKHLPNPETVSNMELVFSKQELQLQGLGWKMLDKEIGTTYTDKFAPIEHLLLQCYR